MDPGFRYRPRRRGPGGGFAWDAATNLLEAATPATRSAGRLEDNRLRVWQDVRFDYDPFGRLATKRKGGWREQRFQYDARSPTAF